MARKRTGSKVIYWQGERFNLRTIAYIKHLQSKVGVKAVVYQGGGEPETPYSGTTHTRYDVGDIWFPGKPGYKVEDQGRKCGGDMWYRYPGVGFDTIHLHFILHPGKAASTDAVLQHHNHHDKGDGLWPLVMGDDPGPNRPCSTTFDYDAWLNLRKINHRIQMLGARVDHYRHLTKKVLRIKTKKDRERDRIKKSLKH